MGDPVQVVAPFDQEQPASPEHALWVVFELQAVTVPSHVELHEQPYSALQEVDVVFEPHAVTVPLQGALQVQPDWAEHTVWEVIEAQPVRVPVQGTDQAQPEFEQRLEDWKVVQSDGVPEQMLVPGVQLHPMLRHWTFWYE